MIGVVGPDLPGRAAYLVAVGLVGLGIASRRLGGLLTF